MSSTPVGTWGNAAIVDVGRRVESEEIGVGLRISESSGIRRSAWRKKLKYVKETTKKEIRNTSQILLVRVVSSIFKHNEDRL